MRVISGKYRGRVLNSPKNNDIRPTSDMIKESIFNIIQSDVGDSRFLDLFAGSGAMGIEALSRGAKEVVFVDNNRDSIATLKANLAVVGENSQVINSNYASALASLKGKQFDIIYVDPPFVNRDIQGILADIMKCNVLADTGIVIYESLYSKENKPEIEDFILIKCKKYGTISIDIYSRN